MTDESEGPRIVSVLLVIVPLWLLLSGAGAVWYFRGSEDRKEQENQQFYARSVSPSAIQDDVKKFVEIIGERNVASPVAAKNLTRAAAMIEGTLGPSNTGFTVMKELGPLEWPLLYAKILGTHPEKPSVWVICSYDSREKGRGVEANATGLAAVLAAAQALVGEKPRATVHFAFVPHANDSTSPVAETTKRLAERIGRSSMVLTVEAMGSGEVLWLSSQDSSAAPLEIAQGLGMVRNDLNVVKSESSDLASRLFQLGIPAVRVATRPLVTAQDADANMPSGAVLAASAGRLVELIRRCANQP